jgi:hypothetical protein
MRVYVPIPIGLSTSPFIPLPRFFHSRRTPPLLTPSLVLFPQHSVKVSHDVCSFWKFHRFHCWKPVQRFHCASYHYRDIFFPDSPLFLFWCNKIITWQRRVNITWLTTCLVERCWDHDILLEVSDERLWKCHFHKRLWKWSIGFLNTWTSSVNWWNRFYKLEGMFSKFWV